MFDEDNNVYDITPKEVELMAAKYEVDEEVQLKGKVVSVTSDETGTVYQVKLIANDKAVTQYFKEDELSSGT